MQKLRTLKERSSDAKENTRCNLDNDQLEELDTKTSNGHDNATENSTMQCTEKKNYEAKTGLDRMIYYYFFGFCVL